MRQPWLLAFGLALAACATNPVTGKRNLQFYGSDWEMNVGAQMYAPMKQSQGGEFILRIEDTDRKRSTSEAIDAIIDGLSWLGLEWDGDPFYQHAMAERHGEVVEQLLARGRAYKCYATPEELEKMRESRHGKEYLRITAERCEGSS